MLGIEQKKGNDENLCGRMIAYARILPVPEGESNTSPFDDMIQNGLLTLEGDFRQAAEKRNRNAFTKAVDAKLDNLLETMQEEGMDLPANIDVEAARERLHELSNMEVIPIPARIGNFTKEEDILQEDADIYYIGEFVGANQAHYCLTTLPIYYQAKYREQAKREEMDFLSAALEQIEAGDFVDTDDLQKNNEELFPAGITLNNFVGDLSKLLNVRVIPFLLALESDYDYDIQVQQFFTFMKGYPDQNDIKRIDISLREIRNQRDSMVARQLLELSCKKVCAVYDEDAALAQKISQDITDLLK
ncbi:MAG: hypothetical protein MJZ25_16215 [Fibrobacter sp.]|nr:hypothetical protein [Fibrobacter sp.]